MAFDAIVVGTGFGGAVSAARLAERGLRVLVLERGPYWGASHRHLPKADRRALPRGVRGIRKLLRSVRVSRSGRHRERVYHPDGLLEYHRFEHLRVVTASGVGGGSHIYTGILDVPAPEFFDAFPEEIDAREMRPDYERVRQMLRPERTPTPRAKDRVFEEAVRAAGLAEAGISRTRAFVGTGAEDA